MRMIPKRETHRSDAQHIEMAGLGLPVSATFAGKVFGGLITWDSLHAFMVTSNRSGTDSTTHKLMRD